MTRSPLPAFLVFFVLLFSTLTVAEIKSITLSDDSQAVILFQKFGFSRMGHVTVSASSVSVSSPSYSPTPDSSRLGFILISDELLPQVVREFQQDLYLCILDSHYVVHLFSFRDLSPPPRSQFNQTYPVTHPDEYSLFFVNCVPETKVSMKIRTEMYNLDRNGSKDYSAAGSTQLPALYFIFSLCYLTFLGLWVYLCRNNKQIVQRIHLFMAALLLAKTLDLICAAGLKHYVKVTGTSHGWNVLFYVFRSTTVVLLFTVIVLIGTGWSFLKPKLQEKKTKKKLLMIVIPLQVLANIASVVIGETGPFSEYWVIWNQIFLLADIICCCAIIFAMVWWMCCSLRKSSKTEALAKLTRFRGFYVLVIAYLFFTRIGVFALKVIADYKYEWVSNAAEEIASLAFYILMFYMFRPTARKEYFGVDEEEEAAAEIALKEEEPEL
ncbi:unnamed protein product [Microthlaspi erraticum]|uniref:Intimal thickness related receptor IRP domain-containing protein n=1 Tax=Microthlaspi erraticum TaxID=1685480 RepID=A0A6D2I0C3_9BRAS|nr:unnamed protein product [Microthlaspi erraticum]